MPRGFKGAAALAVAAVVSAAVEAVRPRRDVRVDRIGFVALLQKRYVDELVKPAVKGSMAEGETVVGDHFEATLVRGGVSADVEVVNADEVLRLFERGLLTRKELAGMITIDPKGVRTVGALTVSQIGRLIKKVPGKPLSPKLVVGLREGSNLKLADAVLGLHAAIAGDEARSEKKAA